MSVRTILQACLRIVAQAFDDDHLNCTFQSMVTGIIVLADQGRRADAEAEFRAGPRRRVAGARPRPPT
jgi:hypothetical protein